MKLKFFLRPSLAIILGFIGVFIARSGTPPEIFLVTGRYFLVIAFLAFATLGFILPDILELAGKAGITALAHQIVKSLPKPRRRKKINSKNLKYSNPLIIDTSALIDGRFMDVVRTGFMYGTFLIIPSVIKELHRLADSADDLTRARGRRGLDNLESLKSNKGIKVEVLEAEPEEKTVDESIIKLAKKLRAKVVTVDFNLGKVAKVRDLIILNVNELANAVKTAVLPGERLKIQITAIGREKSQGVGYLEDGTMVVVEEGANLKGKNVEMLVQRVLQTAAGKMIFGKLS